MVRGMVHYLTFFQYNKLGGLMFYRGLFSYGIRNLSEPDKVQVIDRKTIVREMPTAFQSAFCHRAGGAPSAMLENSYRVPI